MKINFKSQLIGDNPKLFNLIYKIQHKNTIYKSIILSFAFALCSLGSHAQYSVGVGLVAASSTGMNFETESEVFNIGTQLKFQYRIKDFMAVSPNLTLFRKSQTSDFSFSYLETSLNVQLNVINIEQNRGYVILGPVYNRSSFVLPATVNGNEATIEGSLNRYGGNIGFGVEQKSNFYQEFIIQYKTKLKGSNFREIQFLVKIGYLFNIGKPKSEYRKSGEVLTQRL